MPFDLTTWKDELKQALPGFRARMQRAGVNSTYAMLAATALLPVVTASQQGDLAALMALGGVLGNVGVNLVSNLIQNWRDETHAAQHLEAEIARNDDLRAALDRLLETLEAPQLAERSLSDADRAWFAEALQKELAQLKSGIRYEAHLEGDGAIAQGNGAKSVGAGGILVEGDLNIYGREPGGAKPLPPDEARDYYLNNLIAAHSHLRLQGIRAGSQPLSVALEKVYVSLTAVDKHATDSPRKRADGNEDFQTEPGFLTIAAALKRYRRLVIIGDPGSGKTTLLAFLTLTYARALRRGSDTVQKRLLLDEADHLPVFLPLRELGYHLREKKNSAGMEGPADLLSYLRAYYQAQNIPLPEAFFDKALKSGKIVILLDGLDEVAELSLRQRVARLIEKFAARYPDCRFVVTSREVGYEGAARIGAQFGLARVRDFSPAEVRQFLHDWTRVVESTLAGSEAPEVLRLADGQSQKLIAAIESNPRVAELAVNPLLLTVIALVHRYRAQLPERRSELYEEAIEVLLGHWDEAKGMDTAAEVTGVTHKLDSGDRRSLLEPVALWMHERQQREIERDDLRPLLMPSFKNLASDPKRAAKALDDFLRVINERSGLLIERGIGVYGFAHLTFQEYLAARALADRADALAFTLKVLPDPWWREVILLQAGYLSGQGKRRVSELIRSILDADPMAGREPHHHLLLAAECLFDVGNARVEGDLLGEAKKRLQKQADAPLQKGNKPSLMSKLSAMNALARIESGQITSQYWRQPWGEPDWVTIPAGEFWMGSENGNNNEKPLHPVLLPEYQIARVPVTNAQYAIYVKDSGVKPPAHWRGGEAPRGLKNHPVVDVSWDDAMAYCKWLGEKTHKNISLPSEAEWEKAARGDKDKRAYPWEDAWKDLHCNSYSLELGTTTPVGLFLNGASPYGVLDMSGNVWEWTHSLYRPYPYDSADGRENEQSDGIRVLRGGYFGKGDDYVRCAYRRRGSPYGRLGYIGFRVVVCSRSAAGA